MIPDETKQHIQQLVESLLDTMGFSYDSVTLIERDERLILMITTENAKPLIGVQGAHLNALHILIRQIVSQQFGYTTPFTLDVNNYREHQREALVRKAHTIAERARSFQSAIEMEPMSSYERFIVHDTLSEMKDIETYSEGTGKERRVIVRCTKRY